MKKYILYVVLYLSACVVSNQINVPTPNDFIGQNQSALLSYYGSPDSLYNITPSKSVWVYQKTNLAPKQNPYKNEFLYQGWQNPSYGLPEVQTSYSCTLYFTIENTVITNYSFNGDDC